MRERAKWCSLISDKRKSSTDRSAQARYSTISRARTALQMNELSPCKLCTRDAFPLAGIAWHDIYKCTCGDAFPVHTQ